MSRWGDPDWLAEIRARSSKAASPGASTTSRDRSRSEPFRAAYLAPFDCAATSGDLGAAFVTALRLGWVRRGDPPTTETDPTATAFAQLAAGMPPEPS